MIKRYVVGFMFDLEATLVLLIKKQRPDWMKGLWNGVGGHIEVGEEPAQAMRREFKEETGIDYADWELGAHLQFPNAEIYFYRAFSEILFAAQSKTDEQVEWFNLRYLPNVVTNLHWLIPMMCYDSPGDNVGLAGGLPYRIQAGCAPAGNIEDALTRLELFMGGEWDTNPTEGFRLISALRKTIFNRD